MKRLIPALVVLVMAAAARAEVTDRSAAGFEVLEKATIAAPAARVYAAFLTPGRWWSSDHSWSGDARNLTIDLASGCFCEKLAGGQVRHMRVVYADGKSLILEGALGPLSSTGATGHLALRMKETDGKTAVNLVYDVGGYAKGGLAESWAGPVDGVLGAQLARLKSYVETGQPD